MAQSDVFTSLRAALETVRGTGINPVRVLEQTDFSHTPDVATIRPMERRGSLYQFYRASAGREQHACQFSGNLTYNQAAWLGQVFMKGGVTGVGAGADKVYAYTPTGSADDLKSATLEFGWDTALSANRPGYRMVYAVGDELGMTFDKANTEGVTFTASMHSPKAASSITSFGGSPSSLTSTAVVPTVVQVYIDATTIGTTEDDSVMSCEWTLTNTWADLDTLNQTTAAQDTFLTGRTWTASMTRGPITGGSTAYADYLSKALKKIRVLATGPTLGATTYKLSLDLYGVYTGFDRASVDGLVTESLTFEPVYDSAVSPTPTDVVMSITTAETTIT